MNDNEFLLALREYIEQVELKIEGEWGVKRSLEKLIAEGDMPPLYTEVLRRLGQHEKADTRLLQQALEVLDNLNGARLRSGLTVKTAPIADALRAALRERLAADDARVDAEVQLRFLNRMIAAKRLNKGEEK